MTRTLIALLWIVWLLIGSGRNMHAQVSEQDSLALVALYDATNGPNWAESTNWLQSPVSRWKGVNVAGGRVTTVDLNVNQLRGMLPPDLGNLTGLTDLRLEHNQLIGSIPPELGNLTKLEDLRLVSNQLSGAIPPELGNLTNLTDLHLNHNQFTGAIPSELGKLVNLDELSLASNQFSGSIPPDMSNLAKLTFLSVSGNPLSGTLPLNLTDLSLLDTFWFDETNLCEPIDDAFKAWLDGITDVNSTGCVKTPTGDPIPIDITLEQNYPNPFNSATNIEYALPERVAVRLSVYDLQGRLVAVLVDGEQSSGSHEVSFVGEGLPSGVYSYQLEAGNTREVRHMLLFR